jgi:hypothetical protein
MLFALLVVHNTTHHPNRKPYMMGNSNNNADAAAAGADDHRAPPATVVAIAGQVKKQDPPPVNSHHSHRRVSGKSTTCHNLPGVSVVMSAAESQPVGESTQLLPPPTTMPLREQRATVLGRRHTRRVTHFVTDEELDAMFTDHYKGLSITSQKDNDDGGVDTAGAAMMLDAPQNESRNDQGGH